MIIFYLKAHYFDQTVGRISTCIIGAMIDTVCYFIKWNWYVSNENFHYSSANVATVI